MTWHTTNASACSGYPNGDDDYADVNISTSTSPANDFTFTFAGVARTSVRIYSNGMMTFGTDNSGLLARLHQLGPAGAGCRCLLR